MSNWRTPKFKKLIIAILGLKKESDLQHFLRDLCTLDELEELSTRWEIAQMINENKSYREIAKKTKTSTTTVARIAYWLNNGEGGYKKALENIKK